MPNSNEITTFNFNQLVTKLLNQLPQRTRQILIKRFNIDGEGFKTLEGIGREYKVTRERIRQIESDGLEQLKKAAKENSEVESGVFQLKDLIANYGGIISKEHFWQVLARIFADKGFRIEQIELEKQSIGLVILLASGDFKEFKETPKLKSFWAIDLNLVQIMQKLLDEVVRNFSATNKTLSENELLSFLKKSLGEDQQQISDVGLVSFLKVSEEIDQNPFGEWGLKRWSKISPRGIKEKVYLVLKHEAKPMHFRAISDEINQIWKIDPHRPKKFAKYQTVHNELIKDKKFVLVGKGIYALGQWGYKSGTVLDVIFEIFKKSGNVPLERKEIIQKVLSQRQVKENTIIFNLSNKNYFKKVDKDRYILQNKNRYILQNKK